MRETPDAVAVDDRGRLLTYGHLDAEANRLARRLMASGVGPDVLVGVCMERRAELVTALMAVLKASGAYLPLDPEYPAERLAFMLDDGQARVLLTEEGLLGILPESNAEVLCVDRDRHQWRDLDPSTPPVTATEDNLAYTIYTSGSTGRAKGVAIAHASDLALVEWSKNVFPDADLEGVLASTSVCFDLSVFEIFVTLGRGGRVILAKNALELPELPSRDNVTLINTVPSALRELLRSGHLPPRLRIVNLAGEALPRSLVDRAYEEPAVEAVFNLYGPSEDTTYSTWERVDRGPGAPPIGRPVDGTRALVLDKNLAPVPRGEEGELYLAGAGLARGYLDRPSLTASRWLPEAGSNDPGARMYRTGDLVREGEDGTLFYLGRIDHQVKIRGFRIELGEVEARITRHPAIVEAVAVAREDAAGNPVLVAYVVASPGAEPPSARDLTHHVGETLPGHMVPSAFVLLDALPLTPNGKVDRKALPAPDLGLVDRGEVVAPRNAVERRLADLFGELLGVEKVGVEDSFFELGGHSLLGARLAARLRTLFGVDLHQRDLFEAPTVAALGQRLGDLGESSGAEPMPAVDPTVPQPLSQPQLRIWYLHQFQPSSAMFNILVAAELLGPLDTELLRRALDLLVERHGSLRTRYHDTDDGPRQTLDPPSPVELPIEALQGNLQQRRRLARLRAVEEGKRILGIDRGEVHRLRLLRVAEDEHLLVWVQHHIASDGESLRILWGELGAAYGALLRGEEPDLGEPPAPYLDYSAWHADWLDGDRERALLDYWVPRLEGAERLELPADRPRPEAPTLSGGKLVRTLDVGALERLRRLGGEHGATLFMVTLAAYQAWLARVTGQSDVVLGVPMAGRPRGEVEGTVGFFINNAVIKADLGDDPTFLDLLLRTRNTTLDDLAHQDLSLDTLVREVQPPRSVGRNPFFDTSLQVRPDYFASDVLEGLETRLLPEIHNGTTKMDFEVALVEDGDTLRAEVEYSTERFDRDTAERLLDGYLQVLGAAAAHPEHRITRLRLLSPEQRSQILDAWNATDAPLQEGATIHGLVAAQAERTPDATALVVEERRWTYAQLMERGAPAPAGRPAPSGGVVNPLGG
ncbi:MAG: amino acid adenylation domain-containing protein, partial [Acidobacteriota bacterium]